MKRFLIVVAAVSLFAVDVQAEGRFSIFNRRQRVQRATPKQSTTPRVRMSEEEMEKRFGPSILIRDEANSDAQKFVQQPN